MTGAPLSARDGFGESPVSPEHDLVMEAAQDLSLQEGSQLDPPTDLPSGESLQSPFSRKEISPFPRAVLAQLDGHRELSRLASSTTEEIKDKIILQ